MRTLATKPGAPHLDFEMWAFAKRTVFFLFTALLCLSASAQQPLVVKLTLHDTIQPITADYLQRGLREAANLHASAVLVSLGTPGGLLSSTRDIVQSIEQSPVPVIVYISPAGSRAGSAGFFILESADIAAMAPGTNAGAAHPILEGQDSSKLDPILKQKIENDATAFLRSCVTVRGRNVAAAEDGVINSKSYSDSEALKLNLIDLVSPDDTALLNSLDNRQIHRFDKTAVTLHLHGAQITTIAPSLRERLLTRLASPDLAVLLVILGGLLIYLEFNVPGTIVPGALGTLLLLLGIFGLNLLPVRHTAVLLLLAAIILIVLELKFTSHGVLAAAGIGSLIFGLATLVDGPIPEMRVHISVAVAAGLAFGGITFGLAWIALKARRNKVLTGPQALIGALAVVRTPLAPVGQVEVRGELWQAHTQSGASILPGVTVSIRAVDGLQLLVDPITESATNAQ